MSLVTKPIFLDETGKRIADAVEVMALNSIEPVSKNMKWASVKNIVRSGLGKKLFNVGDQLIAKCLKNVSASVGDSAGITAASVTKSTFFGAESVIGSGVHVFTYRNSVWYYNDDPVSLSNYGINVTGTPVDGDNVIVTETYNSFDMDVVTMQDATNLSNEIVPALWLQSHWSNGTVQYDASEAIWACTEELPAGTYHFTIGCNWGSKVVANKVYQFTLSNSVPIGGQIVIGNDTNFYEWGAPSVDPSNWKIYTFSEPKSVTPIDGPVSLTEGSGGTDLGTLTNTTKYSAVGGALNNIYRAGYGYNRWSQSAVRQWLNSNAGVGEWWTPKSPFDRPPQQLSSIAGYLNGFSSDFLDVVQPVKVVTLLNTITDSDIGTSEITYDRFFLPSIEQEYIQPAVADIEGPYFPYWKNRLELDSPQVASDNVTNAKHIRYNVESHSYAQTVRCRTPYIGSPYYNYFVKGSNGSASAYTSTSSYSAAPVCVIC